MADGEPGIGPYLARQRKLRRISLDELASRTKIPRRSLERLESGAFDRSPDGFSRGFVRAVAAALGLDADEAVMRLLSEPGAEEADEAGRPRPWGDALGTPLLLGALLLAAVCGAGLLLWGVFAWREQGAAPEPPPVVFRRDAVRELVDAPSPASPSARRVPPGPAEHADAPD